jgi:hypothetical protein
MSVGPRSEWRGGDSASRFSQLQIIGVFVALFLILTAAAVLYVALAAPATPKSVCPLHRECANPPRKTGLPSFASLSAPLQVGNGVYVSPSLGYRIEYPTQFQVAKKTATGIELVSPNGTFIVLIAGVTATQATPKQLMARTLSDLGSSIPDLQADSNVSAQILSPALAGRAGVGGFYQGNLQSPSGLVSPADVALVAATDEHQTIVAAAVSANRSQSDAFFLFVDQGMLDALRFKRDLVQ